MRETSRLGGLTTNFSFVIDKFALQGFKFLFSLLLIMQNTRSINCQSKDSSAINSPGESIFSMLSSSFIR